MQRIKGIEKVFAEFSSDKAPFPIIHIDKKESKAGLPFVIKPAASYNGLGGFIIPEPVHNKKEYISPPAIVRI